MDKYKELSERTIKLLELTRKKVEQYGNERKILDKYLREYLNDENYIHEWEDYLNKFELEFSKN